jgi:hypothetical protein
MLTFVIASEAKQSILQIGQEWIASSLTLLAMTAEETNFDALA